MTPPPAPAVDRNAIIASVAALTRQFDCAELKTALSDDLALGITGFVASACG